MRRHVEPESFTHAVSQDMIDAARAMNRLIPGHNGGPGYHDGHLADMVRDIPPIEYRRLLIEKLQREEAEAADRLRQRGGKR